MHALIEGFGWTAAFQIAEAYAYRGEVDKAFEWLDRAHAQRDPGVTYSANDWFLRRCTATRAGRRSCGGWG